ncbi:MAG: DUF817 domain-containing protein [Fimbriimonadaceae bacterium]|nr:DUF817 family protein [Chthonomonadaceae bacterium]MCO5295645.1 DUF817 domain-containing protein [Fimbriimonadaceae bacterium]
MREFAGFFLKQVRSSVFALFIFAMLAVSHWQHLLPRYDFMLLTCLGMQFCMVWSGLESKKELVAVCAFHAVGLGLELFKVSQGSWIYPEFAFTKFLGVPLFSGFMYASVASYVFQAYRVFDLEVSDMPNRACLLLGVGLVYANFFTSRAIGDYRAAMIVGLALLLMQSSARFTCADMRFRMRLPLAFGLIGFFVWVGENLCTYLGAWQYPHQRHGWQWVDPSKIGSWSMMVLVAFSLIWAWKEGPLDAPLNARTVSH